MIKTKIYCTLGPSSLNKDFLKFTNRKVNLLRLNMSHVDINMLQKNINLIKKYSSIPICIDTEGAQIRSKVKKEKIYKKKDKLDISIIGNFSLYPNSVFSKLKVRDILDIGFEGLKSQIIKITKSKILTEVTKAGKLENNKGIYIVNRKINLNYITEKDIKAIQIGKKNKIKNYALSFVNTYEDIKRFNKILPYENKIFKLETKSAMKNLNLILKTGNNFLIDRGDLSKEIGIENVPIAQRKILKLAKKKRKKVYIATNFLESMIHKSFPTRAEVNDIFNAVELGANGIVLAAETAIGQHPKECIMLLKKIFKSFSRL
jgi:pyruvate kinase